MLMFRSFWGSDSRGSERTVDATLPMPLFAKPVQAFLDSTATTKSSLNSQNPLKRRRPNIDESTATVPLLTQDSLPSPLSVKRIKIEAISAAHPEQEPVASRGPATKAPAAEVDSFIERAKDVIQFQFGLEILYKHDELRLIDQELAKCQIALEQLRRCHLIPYPVTCPTPEQMLEISCGKGPAMRTRPGEPVPEWAPPFGVVDGPYARHYAKWLIPDPKFDGVLPEWRGLGQAPSARNVLEGRTTRNSYGDSTSAFGKQRQGRGLPGHKLHALAPGYAQPKDKAGPCVLKRSDGMTVKLVCIDCHRENFSSTQGFINHCRIAHKRDFKSHDEAAIHCGHPIEVDEAGGGAGEEREKDREKTAVTVAGPLPVTSASSSVHPFARSSEITEQDAYAALRSRIDACLNLARVGKSPLGFPVQSATSYAPPTQTEKKSPETESKPSGSFVGALSTPYLSQLLQKNNFVGNLGEHVADAKTREETPDLYIDEDSDDGEQAETSTGPASPVNSGATRAPGVRRIRARAVMAPAALSTGVRPTSSKGCSPHMAFVTPATTPVSEAPQSRQGVSLYEDEMDVDLSPNTMTSNNAPSLVSDDGEYDSDDGSSSDASDGMDTDSVTEIKLEDDHEVQDQMPPRGLRKAGSSVGLKKDESRHVTFVSPVRGTAKGRKRKQDV